MSRPGLYLMYIGPVINVTSRPITVTTMGQVINCNNKLIPQDGHILSNACMIGVFVMSWILQVALMLKGTKT